ncbi:MAG: sulfatase [Pirellulales bacterium]|nr:sulfatase [Pirellulales bacterium]
MSHEFYKSVATPVVWRLCVFMCCCVFLICPALAEDAKKPRTNVLLITADDMNCDSVGAYGCKVSKTTPNIDRLAEHGMRFVHSHVTIAVCQPCRGVWATGRYPHRSGIEGFQHMQADHPTLMQTLKEAGYITGILGKVGHSTPKAEFEWDMVHDMKELGQGRDPGRYRDFVKGFFQRAKADGRPFYLMVNSHDPHRPFSGSDQEAGMRRKYGPLAMPSHIFQPGEVVVPGFLPDIPPVRREIAEYYSSVRRCDDTVGAVLDVLHDSGMEGNTLVMFLSDHGMPLPFAKTNVYLHSTRTPWIVCWPGKVKAGTIDQKHFISGVDLMPTVLDALKLPLPDGMDGFSFLLVLEGKSQAGRDKVFTQFHQTSARRRYPMRCVQNRRWGYIFNPWSDDHRVFRNESQSGRSFKAMKDAAETDQRIAERVRHFQYRTLEEFYDFENDPDALHNLIDDPKYRAQIDQMRGELADWMRLTGDPALQAFLHRDSSKAVSSFMADQDSRAGPKKRPRKRKKAKF